MPRKHRGKSREKSAVANSVTQDLENPAAENPEAGKEYDEPSTVPSMGTPQPDDPAIKSQCKETKENADRPYRDQH